MKSIKYNNHLTRYYLPGGEFIDRETCRPLQHYGYKYSVWLPGAGHGGIALFICGAETLKDAIALLGHLKAKEKQQ